jgi:hypothetical protein
MGKLRKDFNDKGILFLIDPDVAPPSQAHHHVSFKRTEVIMQSVMENWEYELKESAEEAPKIALDRAMEYLDNRVNANGIAVTYSTAELNAEVQRRLAAAKEEYLAPHRRLNANKWNKEDYDTETKDIAYCEKVLTWLNPVHLSKANRELAAAQTANNKANEVLNRAIQLCLREITSKLGETIEMVGATAFLTRQDFIEVIRQHNIYYFDLLKNSDVEASENRLATITPSGFDLTESLLEIKEAIAEVALMKHVKARQAAAKATAAPIPRGCFDIDWQEVDANSWDRTDESISAVENDYGRMNITVDYRHRLSAIKRFMKAHPHKGFHNQVLQFEKDVEIRGSEIETISILTNTYLEPAQRSWLPTPDASPDEIGSATASAGAGYVAYVPPAGAVSANSRKRSRGAKSAGLQASTYPAPPPGSYTLQTPVDAPQANLARAPRPAKSEKPKQQLFAMVILPNGQQSFQPVGAPRGPAPPRQRSATQCMECYNMGIRGDAALHHATPHDATLAARVLAKEQQRAAAGTRNTNA